MIYLVLGDTGYVGSHFIKYLHVTGRYAHGISRSEVDYTDIDKLDSLLQEVKPDFVINAAGFTGRPNVDACELAKAECLAGNAVLPGVIREACEGAKTPWGHISSGCIYNGGDKGWKEDDTPNFSFRNGPCSFYSGSKALGEEILEGAEDCYIWRLRIPFNHDMTPRNYLYKLLNYDMLLSAENSVSHINEFVGSCIASVEKECEPGTYNLTNPGYVSTRQVIDWLTDSGMCKKNVSYFETMEEFLDVVSTPRSNCILDTSKSERANIAMRPVEEAMQDAIAQMKNTIT